MKKRQAPAISPGPEDVLGRGGPSTTRRDVLFVCSISNLLLLDSLGFVSIAFIVAYAVSYAVAKYFRYKPCPAARTESLFSLVFSL